LPERWQRLVPEMTKFGIIGAINTAVDITILNLLLVQSVGPLKAKIVATVIATTLSYAMNRRWTFASRQRGKMHREYVLFFGLNAIGWIIQMTPIGFAKYGLGFSEQSLELADWVAFNLANIIGTFFGMLFRFWSYRTFVFKTPRQPAAVADGFVELTANADSSTAGAS
jgi:putative flippase GtrA